MRIDDGFQQRLWREPEDTDMRARHAPTPAPEPAPGHAPEPEAAPPFWAAGTPVPPNTLTALPPAQVAAPAPPPPAPTAYVGEAPVDAAWLATRERALVAVRRDYEAARQQALASGGSGPGWQAAQVSTDESGQVISLTGRTLVHVSDPNAQPLLVGYDEAGPVYQQPAGQWLEFNEDAFAAHYRAQGGAPLQQLAASYDTDATTLLARHPDIWAVATQDHAINAGPAPAGRAMGDASQLGMLDLYMADPQVAALIGSYGGSVPPASSGIALEQVRVYGQARYEQLTKLGNAMQSVRDQYSDAMAHAQAHGGPGWTERPRMVTVSDEGGATTTQPLYVTDESGQPLRGDDGQPQLLTERVFDPDAFTAWYVQQGGQQHQAFASFYGRSHTQYSTDESGQTFASSIGFDNPSWSMWGVGGGMSHKELVRIDPNHAPRLNDSGAVGFDLETGWATHHSNIHQKRDWFETVVQVAFVAAVTYFSAGTLGPAVAGAAMGTTAAAATATVAGMAISGAVAGAAGALASGMVNGDVNFKDVLRGALAGGLTGGMLKAVGTAAGSTAGNVAIRATVQGGVQALLGGSFKDGALAGLASGLAEAASAGMQTSIADAVKNGSMTAEQAVTATRFARIVSSAIHVAGTDGDPGQAFASEFLGDLLQQSGLAELALADIEGSGRAALPVAGGGGTEVADAADPRTQKGYFVPDAEHDRIQQQLDDELRVDPERNPFDDGAGQFDDRDPGFQQVGWREGLQTAATSAAEYAQRLAGRIGGDLDNVMQKGLRAAADFVAQGDVAVLTTAKADIQAYLDAKAARGGLSEAEIKVFGVLYAASEALFPTNVADFAGGIGKGITAAAGVIKLGGRADELATVVRTESRAAAAATSARTAEVTARARTEGLELITERNGTKGDWNAALNGDLKPNALYLLDNGHAYATDAAGRVTRADGVLDVSKADRNTWQQAAAGHAGGQGYDGGHLIATLFGGAGEKINLVPQLSTVNRGEFRVMEAEWAKAVLAGQEVKVSVRPVYSGTLGVPDRIVVDAWVNGVRQAPRTFENKLGG